MRQFFSKLAANESLAGFAFILPNLLGFLIFTLLPVIASLCLAFVKWDVLTPPHFVGIKNFVDLLGFHQASGHHVPNDPLFWKYLYNTVFFMLNIPICVIASLMVALMMNQKLRGITIYRTAFFLPTICSGVAVCLLWRWILNPDFGLLNVMITNISTFLHLDFTPPLWLMDTTWAKPALMVMGLWGGIGGMNMILYLAALQNVPKELYEAAEIDGAGAWTKFRTVTVPFISPTTFFITIMSIIGGFQGGFMQAYVMTGGGPAGATTTIEYYIYSNAYEWFKMGYASSIAWFLFVVIFIVTLINWRFGGKRVHY